MGPAKRALLVAAFTLASCSSQTIPAATPTNENNTLQLASTTVAAPLMSNLTYSYSRVQPHITFDLSIQKHATLIQHVQDQHIPFVISQNYPLDSQLWAAPIGQDGLAVVVHPQNTLTNLSVEDIRNIYSGHLLDWQQLANSPIDGTIRVVGRESGSADYQEFTRLVMGGRNTTPSARIAPSNEAMLEIIAADVTAIGYISIGMLQPTVRAVPIEQVSASYQNILNNTYPLRSNLFIIGQTEPTGDYRHFVAWIQSLEGQEIVGQYFAPLTP